MIEFLVAKRAYGFQLGKVAVEERLARPLFTEPKDFKVHPFGVCKDLVVCFVVAGGKELTHENRTARLFFRTGVTIGDKPLFFWQLIARRYPFFAFHRGDRPLMILIPCCVKCILYVMTEF